MEPPRPRVDRTIKWLAVATVVAIIAASGVYAYALVKHESKSSSGTGDPLVIKNTGSTNTKGWNLTIQSDGSGALKEGDDSTKTFKPASFAMDEFRSDVARAGSLESLQPSGELMKSTSFGTSQYATYQDKTSGDLNEDFSKASKNLRTLHDLLMSFVTHADPRATPRFQNQPLQK